MLVCVRFQLCLRVHFSLILRLYILVHLLFTSAMGADIYRVREKKDVFVLKLLKVNLEGSGTARAEFDSEARILAQLQARVHPGTMIVGDGR